MTRNERRRLKAVVGASAMAMLATTPSVLAQSMVERAKAGVASPAIITPSREIIRPSEQDRLTFDPTLAGVFGGARAMLGGGGGSTPISSMFKINLRTGTGSAGSVTGLQFQPDTAIIKRRNGSIGWNWFNSGEGAKNYIDSTTANDYTSDTQSLTAFNSGGISFGTSTRINTSGGTYLDIYAKNTPRFMDCGVKSGLSASGNATIAHNLGVAPGLIIIKGSQNSLDWYVYHRSLGNSTYLKLNSTAASVSSTNIFSSVTSSSFTFNQSVINSTSTQVSWWAFAHDTSATSKIYCDTFTTDGSGHFTISGLPFTPQFLLTKGYSTGDGWYIFDAVRGWASGVNDKGLQPHSTAAEFTGNRGYSVPNGFDASAAGDWPSFTSFIYMAIADS